MEENTSNENRKKSGLLWILIALLAITNGVTFWMYMQEKNKAANEAANSLNPMTGADLK